MTTHSTINDLKNLIDSTLKGSPDSTLKPDLNQFQDEFKALFGVDFQTYGAELTRAAKPLSVILDSLYRNPQQAVMAMIQMSVLLQIGAGVGAAEIRRTLHGLIEVFLVDQPQ